MLGWLRIRKATPRSEQVDHPVLGTLRFDPEVGAWRTIVATSGGSVGFLVAGDDVPDAGLLEHAADIATKAAPFFEHVRSFLLAEAAQQRWADEIKALSLEEVCLFWPKRPDNGMLYFNGPDKNRVWRSGYRDRRAVGLGFDS